MAWTGLALYCGFVAALVLPAQLLALLWRRRAGVAVGSAIAACLAAAVPLMVLAADRGSSQLFWVPHPSLIVEKQTLELLTSAGLQPSFGPQPTMWALIAVTVLIVLAGAGMHVVRAWRPAVAAGDELWGQALVLLWVFVPIVLAFGESLVATPLFIPRNLLICLPAVALALALAVTDARVPKLASCAALAALIALRMVSLVPTYGVSPENWREATRYVLAQSRPGDCVAFYPLDAHMAFAYYVEQSGRHCRRAALGVADGRVDADHAVRRAVRDALARGRAGSQPRRARGCGSSRRTRASRADPRPSRGSTGRSSWRCAPRSSGRTRTTRERSSATRPRSTSTCWLAGNNALIAAGLPRT